MLELPAVLDASSVTVMQHIIVRNRWHGYLQLILMVALHLIIRNRGSGSLQLLIRNNRGMGDVLQSIPYMK
jgi:hypothetical protein